MIKKSIIAVLFMGLMSNVLFAQFTVGPRVGLNMSNVSTPTLVDLILPDFEYLPAIDVGLVSTYHFTDRFALQGEFNYREKGFRVRENMNVDLFNLDLPLGVRVDTRVRFVDIPILARLDFGNGPVTGYVAAGPQLGYALNARVRTRADFLVDLQLTNVPIRFRGDTFERFDLSGVITAGAEFATGSGKIFFDVRYNQSFTDAFNVPVIDLNIRNHGFGLGAGYRIAL